MKNKMIVAVLAVLILPAVVLAVDADKFVAAKPLINQANDASLIIVPIEVSNTQDLVALDIPLGYSQGARLEKVEFTELVRNFDFKIANIQEDQKRVVIGLVTMGKKTAPDLPSGSGHIADLYFRLDPGVESVEISPLELKKPDHTLSYYFNDYSRGYPEVKVVYPEFEVAEYSLSPQIGSVPDQYELSQNSPNPFNPTTRIDYALPEAGHVRLTVLNILGQNVRDLVNEYSEAGTYNIVWDGRDEYGSASASGIYFYRLDINDYSQTRKMLLLK